MIGDVSEVFVYFYLLQLSRFMMFYFFHYFFPISRHESRSLLSSILNLTIFFVLITRFQSIPTEQVLIV